MPGLKIIPGCYNGGEMVKKRIKALIASAMKKENIKGKVCIEEPGDSDHGDYSCNIALQAAKSSGTPPRALAEKIVTAIKKPEYIENITIEGPGFINIKLSNGFLLQNVEEILKQGRSYGKSSGGEGKTAVTDSSHPNIAKPFGVHHLLSTIIGDALNKILAFTGYNIVRDNYLGDWGTQFGKLIYAYRAWGDEKTVKNDPIPELLKLYVKFHDEAEKNPALEDEGRKEFKKLEDRDPENKKLWQWMVKISMEEFQKMYKTLNVEFDVSNGESFYEDKMPRIIELGKAKGVFVEGEKGALIVEFEDANMPPYLILKSDGATLYATRDLARIDHWERTWHPSLMINVVDVAQELYFRQLFETARRLKLTGAEQVHVQFGRMQFPDAQMSTRKGNILLLEDVITEAVKRARAIVDEKNPELSNEEKKTVANAVGIGAVKYSVLSQNRTTNITFTWDKMLALEGNSAPYLQYSYARAMSILRKANETGENIDVIMSSASHDIKTAEHELMRKLVKFQEAVTLAAEAYKPNLIANYLYELTQEFNRFYNSVRVLQAEHEGERARLLAVVRAVTIVLKNGMGLLGIEAPERM